MAKKKRMAGDKLIWESIMGKEPIWANMTPTRIIPHTTKTAEMLQWLYILRTRGINCCRSKQQESKNTRTSTTHVLDGMSACSRYPWGTRQGDRWQIIVEKVELRSRVPNECLILYPSRAIANSDCCKCLSVHLNSRGTPPPLNTTTIEVCASSINRALMEHDYKRFRNSNVTFHSIER